MQMSPVQNLKSRRTAMRRRPTRMMTKKRIRPRRKRSKLRTTQRNAQTTRRNATDGDPSQDLLHQQKEIGTVIETEADTVTETEGEGIPLARADKRTAKKKTTGTGEIKIVGKMIGEAKMAEERKRTVIGEQRKRKEQRKRRKKKDPLQRKKIK